MLNPYTSSRLYHNSLDLSISNNRVVLSLCFIEFPVSNGHSVDPDSRSVASDLNFTFVQKSHLWDLGMNAQARLNLCRSHIL